MSFTGTQIRYWFSQAPHHGIATVSIDGKAPTAVDLYAAARTDGTASWLSSVLASGTHTLKITVSGTRNPRSTDNVVVIDRIDVIAAAAALVGDLNGDGHVTAADLAVLLSHWNQTIAANTGGDLNGDGKVGSADLALLLSNWGK